MNDNTEETTWEAPALESGAEGVPTGVVVATAGVTPHAEVAGEITTALTSWEGSEDDVQGVVEEHALVTASTELQFPFYVNERGNRVFCVPRKAGSKGFR